MRSRAETWLASFALVLASAGAGFFVGRWSASSDAPKPSPGDGAASQREVLNALADLRRAIDERFSRAREDSPAAIPRVSEREPAVAVAPDIGELKESLEKLSLLVQEALVLKQSAGASNRSLPPEFVAPGYPSLTAMRERYDAMRRPPEDESDWWPTLQDEFNRAHLLWTVPDVVARYGLPTHVGAEGSGLGGRGTPQLTLAYEGVRSAVETCEFTFIVREGFVMSVGCGCDDVR